MLSNTVRLLIALAAISIAVPRADAGTSTGQIAVTLTLQAECKLDSTSDLAFGSTGVLQAAILATSVLEVQCTNTLPYNISLNVGTGLNATVASRKLTSGSGSTVNYELFRDTGHSQAWGDTIGTNTVAATGTGAAQHYTVYGRVPVQTTPAAGNYTDTVQVTITY